MINARRKKKLTKSLWHSPSPPAPPTAAPPFPRPPRLPVDDEVVELGGLVADRTRPRRLLLVHLQEGSGVEALDVAARVGAAWLHDAHLTQLQQQRNNNNNGRNGSFFFTWLANSEGRGTLQEGTSQSHLCIVKLATIWCYSIPLALQHSIGATAFHWCYSIPLALQHSIGATAFHWRYSIPLALQHSVGATAFRWCYSIPLVLQHSIGATAFVLIRSLQHRYHTRGLQFVGVLYQNEGRGIFPSPIMLHLQCLKSSRKY